MTRSAPAPTVTEAGQGAVPDYRMPCRRCGGTFIEMKDLLFHPCQQPARSKQKRQPKKARRRS